MADGDVRQRPSVWPGVATLTGALTVLGLQPVLLWTISQLPALALVDGVQLPGPLPTLGLPLGDEPSWAHWATRVVGAVTIPVVFWLWMSRESGGLGRIALRAWKATVVAIVAGCLLSAVLESMIMAGGLMSFVLMVGGTLLLGTLVGVVVGLLVALVVALTTWLVHQRVTASAGATVA